MRNQERSSGRGHSAQSQSPTGIATHLLPSSSVLLADPFRFARHPHLPHKVVLLCPCAAHVSAIAFPVPPAISEPSGIGMGLAGAETLGPLALFRLVRGGGEDGQQE